MPVTCRFCGSENVRPSLLRIGDLAFLLVLRHPIRCRRCRHRSHVSVFKIAAIRRQAQARSRREAREQQLGPAVFVDSPPRQDYDWAE